MKKVMTLIFLIASAITVSLGNEKIELLPTIEESIVIQDWLAVGPFSRGMREGDIDYLIEHEGELGIKPYEGLEHTSMMAASGLVKWMKVKGDEQGTIKITYNNINQKQLQDIYGNAGTMSVSYAYAEFESKGARRALVIAERIDTFRLNNKPWPGDIYGSGYAKIPVVLQDGRNKILVKLTRGEQFTFKIIPAEAAVMVLTGDATVPDAVVGKHLKQWAGVSVVNTATKTLKNIKLSLGDGQVFLKQEVSIAEMAPLSIRKVPIPIESKAAISEQGVDNTISVPVLVSTDQSSHADQIKLRIRNQTQAYKTTFLSRIDGSVQYFAVLPPKNYDSNKTYALILSLHGAGVEASGQADAYRAKDWAFVVCPTNRKPFGFDWQDWGRLDCLEVLSEAKSQFPIDNNRIYLTGHSMGGHGTWHIGLHHPDLFAAMAPSAGWTSFQLYVPYFLRKSDIFGHPGLLAIRDMGLREERLLNFVENALNLPIYILQGGADDNVPPVHARFFYSALKKLGYQAIYREVEGMGHWWDNKETEGIDCVDSDELLDFLRNGVRNPNPKHIIFKTTDIGLNNKNDWLEIDEPERLYHDSLIDAEIKDGTITVKTENVAQFTIHLSSELISQKEMNLKINGQELRCKLSGKDFITLHNKGRQFQLKKSEKQKLLQRPSGAKNIKKSAAFFGPIKKDYFSPFILIYGTQGDSDSTEINLHHARVEAQNWWFRGNGHVEIIPDIELNSEIIHRYNLILFGGPETNAVTAKIMKDLPISIKNDRLIIDGQEIEKDDVAFQMVYPNPLNPEKYVVIKGGTSPKAEELAGLFNVIYSGSGLPDFLIYDETVKEKGWAAIIATGFFDVNWKFDNSLAYEKN
jgi:pimeloyl-ACP methyl ester carboxylesterase